MTPSMNAHNEQHDPASAVVKQNLTTQPATAQEAVLRIYAEGDMRVVTEWLDGSRDLPDGDHRLYAAPVTAAPAELDRARETPRRQAAVDAMLAMGFIWDSGAWRAQSDGGMQDERNRWFIRAGEYLKRAQDAEAKLASTPAAPGIDLEQFREAIAYWRDTALRDMQYQNGLLHEQANEGQRLLDLIDAIANGGNDEAAWSAGYQAAMNEAASGVQELYRNHVHHMGSDGLIARAMQLEQNFLRDGAMQAQASDAEVQP